MELMRNESRGVSLYLSQEERLALAAYLADRAAQLGRSVDEIVRLTGLSRSGVKCIIGGRRAQNAIALRTVVAVAEFGLSLSLDDVVRDLGISVDPTVDLADQVDHARALIRQRLLDGDPVRRSDVNESRKDRVNAAKRAARPVAAAVTPDLPTPAKPSNGAGDLTLEQMVSLLGRERVEAIVRRAFAEALDRVAS